MSFNVFGSADLAAIFRDQPVTLTSAAATTPCTVDEEDVVEDGAGGQALVRRTVVRYRAAALTAPTIGGSITLDSDNYKVRDVQREGDGGMIRLIVSRA